MNDSLTCSRKRIAVLASGNGSNLQAIIDYSKNTDINGDIVFVLSNNPDAFALKRAASAGIETICIPFNRNNDRLEYDRKVLQTVKDKKIDLVCLAGYMLLLSSEFINQYFNKVINIHPSLLPSFKGVHGIMDAFNYGVRVTGVTVHFVENELDTGPIISQEAVIINDGETIEDLEKKIHEAEHRIYPPAIRHFCRDELRITGQKVMIMERG